MKKYLVTLTTVVAMAAPSLALAAAYNDVSLSNGTRFSIGGIIVNVTNTATLNTVVADISTLSVTLGPSSSVILTAPNLNKLSLSSSVFTTSNQCDGTASTVTLSAGGSAATTTIVVTPSSSLCGVTVAPVAQGGGNPYSSYNRGVAPGASTVPTSIATTTTSVATSTFATSTSNTTTPATSGNTSLATTLRTQLNALLTQIAQMTGAGSQSNTLSGSFTRDLRVGSKGDDVKALQAYLNGKGYPIALTGPGSAGMETIKFGNGTKKALMKFQKSVGIKPANGLLGAKTRAYIAANP